MRDIAYKNSKSELKFVYSENNTLSIIFQNNDLLLGVVGEFNNNSRLRFGTGKYEAEKLKNSENISLWRSSIFASLESEYEIWKMNQKDIDQNQIMDLSPILINVDSCISSSRLTFLTIDSP